MQIDVVCVGRILFGPVLFHSDAGLQGESWLEVAMPQAAPSEQLVLTKAGSRL